MPKLDVLYKSNVCKRYNHGVKADMKYITKQFPLSYCDNDAIGLFLANIEEGCFNASFFYYKSHILQNEFVLYIYFIECNVG